VTRYWLYVQFGLRTQVLFNPNMYPPTQEKHIVPFAQVWQGATQALQVPVLFAQKLEGQVYKHS